ncbi:ferritin-like domain-containing protein [Gillisia hiemivivida]|uniref:Ferritin-like domain-containing protein n=1 Tax=Gillisia hiemivivida TaxID=291190 RepID=A0A5C6ZRH1_9FLAO|nr:ferritin-like domain-containing protein [Gillisia hiemivivida]TXD92299.1 ferritin-like domain-containing protein [Gillisia hiemivivida]
MNIIKFLDDISNKELLETKGSRRDSFSQMKKAGKNMALASIPFALAATSKKTAAATMAMSSAEDQASPIEVLQFALKLEYLERRFYAEGLDSGVIPAEDRDVFGLIYDHERAHVNFLYNFLDSKGEAFIEPEFDFTGAPGGLSLDPFNKTGIGKEIAYAQFLILAQGFEDTGVRAYKGQAGALIDDNVLLEYALQIHSIEARHASQIRRMRGQKGWITGEGEGSPSVLDLVYAGEGNVVQGGLDLAVVLSQYSVASLTEAFDEPLEMTEVNAIANIFVAP